VDGSASAKKAELQAKLDAYFNRMNQNTGQEKPSVSPSNQGKYPEEDQKKATLFKKYNAMIEEACGAPAKSRYGVETAQNKELPPGMTEEDVEKRNLLYRGSTKLPDGRVIYFFVVKEASGEWGTSVAVQLQEKMNFLAELDKKIAELKQ